MKISDHAIDRSRERMGIPKKAIPRMAEKALEKGIPISSYSGHLRRYLDGIVGRNFGNALIRVYSQHVFIFKDNTLVTVWGLPGNLRKFT